MGKGARVRRRRKTAEDGDLARRTRVRHVEAIKGLVKQTVAEVREDETLSTDQVKTLIQKSNFDGLVAALTEAGVLDHLAYDHHRYEKLLTELRRYRPQEQNATPTEVQVA